MPLSWSQKNDIHAILSAWSGNNASFTHDLSYDTQVSNELELQRAATVLTSVNAEIVTIEKVLRYFREEKKQDSEENTEEKDADETKEYQIAIYTLLGCYYDFQMQALHKIANKRNTALNARKEILHAFNKAEKYFILATNLNSNVHHAYFYLALLYRHLSFLQKKTEPSNNPNEQKEASSDDGQFSFLTNPGNEDLTLLGFATTNLDTCLNLMKYRDLKRITVNWAYIRAQHAQSIFRLLDYKVHYSILDNLLNYIFQFPSSLYQSREFTPFSPLLIIDSQAKSDVIQPNAEDLTAAKIKAARNRKRAEEKNNRKSWMTVVWEKTLSGTKYYFDRSTNYLKSWKKTSPPTLQPTPTPSAILHSPVKEGDECFLDGKQTTPAPSQNTNRTQQACPSSNPIGQEAAPHESKYGTNNDREGHLQALLAASKREKEKAITENKRTQRLNEQLRDQIRSLSQKLESKDQQLHCAEQLMSKAQTENAALKEKIDELNHHLTAANDAITKYQKRAVQKVNENTLKRELMQRIQELTIITQDLKGADDRERALNTRLQELAEENRSLKTQLQALQQELHIIKLSQHLREQIIGSGKGGAASRAISQLFAGPINLHAYTSPKKTHITDIDLNPKYLPNFVQNIVITLLKNEHRVKLMGSVVHGLIRDDLKPGDIDLTTTATQEEVQELFAPYKPTVIKGSNVVHFKISGKDGNETEIEITTRPSEIRNMIKFFKNDAERRDYKANALGLECTLNNDATIHPKLSLVDYFNGQGYEQCKKKELSFCKPLEQEPNNNAEKIIIRTAYLLGNGYNFINDEEKMIGKYCNSRQDTLFQNLSADQLISALSKLLRENCDKSKSFAFLNKYNLVPSLIKMIHSEFCNIVLPQEKDINSFFAWLKICVQESDKRRQIAELTQAAAASQQSFPIAAPAPR